MKVLALSGSIRSTSSNASLLRAVQTLFHFSDADWTRFPIAELPFFDPELQFSLDLPPAVAAFRKLAAEAEFILIATPEYAHGIPGVLKNALEWLVCEETMQKKVAVFISSPSGGEHVKEYLLETLRTMDLMASDEMTFTVTSARKDISSSGEITNPSLRGEILAFLNKIWKS